MSELWLFIGTIVVGLMWLLVGPFLLHKAERPALRAGLWMNGISGREADEILDWRERK
jgi:hypothetical protein